jgi:hypothetical protein
MRETLVPGKSEVPGERYQIEIPGLAALRDRYPHSGIGSHIARPAGPILSEGLVHGPKAGIGNQAKGGG